MLQHLPVERTARLATHGNPATARFAWMVLHGYGQLVPYSIRPFQSLPEEDHFVVAPEGLSRFYLKGTSGRVGASWMTKEDRLSEIEDQIAYLNRVKDWITPQLKQVNVTWIGLGFSQGVATLNRWLAKGQWAPHHIVNWAGSPPWDIAYDQPHLQQAKWWYRLGKEDPYIPVEVVEAWQQKWKAAGLHVQTDYFEGPHTLPSQKLVELVQAIQRVAK